MKFDLEKAFKGIIRGTRVTGTGHIWKEGGKTFGTDGRVLVCTTKSVSVLCGRYVNGEPDPDPVEPPSWKQVVPRDQSHAVTRGNLFVEVTRRYGQKPVMCRFFGGNSGPLFDVALLKLIGDPCTLYGSGKEMDSYCFVADWGFALIMPVRKDDVELTKGTDTMQEQAVLEIDDNEGVGSRTVERTA